MQTKLLVLLIAMIVALVSLPSTVSVELAAPTNPWYAFDGVAQFTFRMGSEISVMTASDGKFFYGRGCCYGYNEKLQVWGTGKSGTTLGLYYGEVSAPPIPNDNGEESVLLYIHSSNYLVYWKFGQSSVYMAQGRPDDIKNDLKWTPVMLKLQNPLSSNSRLGVSVDSLLVSDYDSKIIEFVEYVNKTWATTGVVVLESLDYQLKPAHNEDGHSFAFDGNYFYFGSIHSGNLYGIYNTEGKYISAQWGWGFGSILSYDYALGMYQACGSDASSPPAYQVFNGHHGNGAHCSYWNNLQPVDSPAPPLTPECPSDVPSVFGHWFDDQDNDWLVTQQGCRINISGKGKRGFGSLSKNSNGEFELVLTFASTSGASSSYKVNGFIEDNNTIRLGGLLLQRKLSIQFLTGSAFGPMKEEFSLEMAQKLNKAHRVYLAWNYVKKDSKDKVSTAVIDNLGSYDYIVSFILPPTTQTKLRPRDDQGKLCNDYKSFIPVKVQCLKGDCNMPSTMYWGANSGSVCFGNAIGLVVRKGSLGSCDWPGNDEPYRAIYLGLPKSSAECQVIKDINDITHQASHVGLFFEVAKEGLKLDELRKDLESLVTENLELVAREKQLRAEVELLHSKNMTVGKMGPQGKQGEQGPKGKSIKGKTGPQGFTANYTSLPILASQFGPNPPSISVEAPNDASLGRNVFVRTQENQKYKNLE